MKTKQLALVVVLVTSIVAAASVSALDRGLMAERIASAGNSDYVHMCFRCLAEKTPVPETYDDVPL